MANPKHLQKLREGVEKWNAWMHIERTTVPSPDKLIRPDLIGANLIGMDLRGYDLLGADLIGAHLVGANLAGVTISLETNQGNLEDADLSGADLSGATLRKAHMNRARLNGTIMNGCNLHKTSFNEAKMIGAQLNGADLTEAVLNGVNLNGAKFLVLAGKKADLSRAHLIGADLSEADFTGAMLVNTDMTNANLTKSTLSGAMLCCANLSHARLVDAKLENADVSGSRVYGIAAWGLELEKAIQTDLCITKEGEPDITADDLEVAQFIYLLIKNSRIRNAIDTIGKKAVLILGRFIPGRIEVLQELRAELRNRNYVPILFDFERPESQNYIETVGTLAHLSRFVIADTTQARIVSAEIFKIAMSRDVPIVPILEEGAEHELSIVLDLLGNRNTVLPTFHYKSTQHLLASLASHIIGPAEAKSRELLKGRVGALQRMSA